MEYPHDTCSVEIDGEPCLNPIIAFDPEWDAFECADHLGWWEAQAHPNFDHDAWMALPKDPTTGERKFP